MTASPSQNGRGPRGRILLLGPQGQGTFAGVVDALATLQDVGKVALITTGWQENEGEDDDLRRAIGVPVVNLRLHARSEEVFHQDEDLWRALRERQRHLRHLQDFYRIRLDTIDDASRTITVRHVPLELIDEQQRISIDQFRHLDADHLEHCRAVYARFEAQWDPGVRPIIAERRAEVAEDLAQCDAVVIAGGHVMSLLNRIRLFAALDAVGDRPVIAWSAGAMALTDRIVLFHDSPPFGKNLAQVIADGLGHCPGIVAMPDVAGRVNVEDREGMCRFVRRLSPATCVALDAGASVTFEQGRLVDANAARLTVDGMIEAGWRP